MWLPFLLILATLTPTNTTHAQRQMEVLLPTDAHGWAPVPWAETYYDTAEALAEAAEAEPLFKGPRGVEETIDLLVSLAWFESRFNSTAEGDHGASIGLFQISPHTASLPARLLKDPSIAARAAIRLIKQSRTICRDRPEDEQLAWYARGGSGCSERGFELSRHRMIKAKRLFAEHPFRD